MNLDPTYMLCRLDEDVDEESAREAGQQALLEAGEPYDTLTFSIADGRIATVHGFVQALHQKNRVNEILTRVPELPSSIDNRIQTKYGF